MGAVRDDVHALKRATGGSAEGVEVAGEHLGAAPDGADGGAPRRVGRFPDGGLELLLGGFGELVAAGPEELEAVVLVGIVGGGDHDAAVEIERADEIGESGRRHDAAEERLCAGGAEAGHGRRLEEVAREAGIAPDEKPGTAVELGDSGDGGAGQRGGEFGGQIDVGEPPDAVGSEEFAHGPSQVRCVSGFVTTSIYNIPQYMSSISSCPSGTIAGGRLLR